ncbi:MAG: nicotinate phosphoribosyltransferase [Candidatus Omnitrophica bacterium]|nr:nicotinate phosphoribosyltransferase [Candidatus Omnitrophota bacterium]
MTRFNISKEEDILRGDTTDIYFVRTQEILKHYGIDKKRAYSEFTCGDLPEGYSWAVFCGLDEVLKLFQKIPCDLYALPEGTLFPALDITGVRIPVMTIEGPYGDYSIYETPALGFICQATGIATKSARLRKLAGDLLILSFGIRRMHPAIAPMIDRAAYIGGCDSVSSIIGANTINKEPMGTMPHALVVMFGSQEEAFISFDRVMPKKIKRIMLIDTYLDEKQEAILAIGALGKKLEGVRLDTPPSRRGDITKIVREIRWELDLRGFKNVKIIVSGGIDEEDIPSLINAKADGFGIGTSISNTRVIDFAMDIVELEGKPCAKKGKFSGKKQVFKCSKCFSFLVLPIASAAPSCPDCKVRMKRLLRQYIKNGKTLERYPAIDRIRDYVKNQLKHIGLNDR